MRRRASACARGGSPGRRARPRRSRALGGGVALRLRCVAEPGDDVAQRTELADDRVPALLVAVDLGLERGELPLGLGLAGGGEGRGLGLGGGDDLLGLAAGVAEQPLGLVVGLLAVLLAGVRGLAGRGPRRRWRGPRPPRRALGLGGGAAVVLGGLAGQPLLLHRQRAAGLLHLAVGGGPGLLGLALGAGVQSYV